MLKFFLPIFVLVFAMIWGISSSEGGSRCLTDKLYPERKYMNNWHDGIYDFLNYYEFCGNVLPSTIQRRSIRSHAIDDYGKSQEEKILMIENHLRKYNLLNQYTVDDILNA